MDGQGKIALAIVVAALVLVCGYVGYHEWARRRDVAEIQAALASYRDDPVPKRTLVIPDPETVRLEAQAAPPPDNSLVSGLDRYRLRDDQQCLNGELLQRAPSGVYLHVTERDGSSVRCADRQRLPSARVNQPQ